MSTESAAATESEATPESELDLAEVFGMGELDQQQLNARNLSLQAAVHGFALLAALALWGAADSWMLVTDLALATGFAIIASIAFGIVMVHVIHEWFHFLGAVISGASYTVKERAAPLFFDFDYTGNTDRQFLSMSIAGTVGNLLFIALVVLLVPIDSASRAMLLAVAIGMLFYVGAIEWPVVRYALQGRSAMDALVAHFGQGAGVLNRALFYGVLTGLVSWWIIWF